MARDNKSEKHYKSAIDTWTIKEYREKMIHMIEHFGKDDVSIEHFDDYRNLLCMWGVLATLMLQIEQISKSYQLQEQNREQL